MQSMLDVAARNTLILAAFVDATEVLVAAQIPSLPLKGGALLAAGIVPRGERHLDDLDLWVRPGDALAARAALRAAGFTPATRPSATHRGGSLLQTPTHQLPALFSRHGAVVEIHLESHAVGAAGVFDSCYAAGHDFEVFGVNVRVPCTLHMLEQLCAHVVVHHGGELKYWPRHVSDVRALLTRDPSLARLMGRPDEVGLSLRVAHGQVDPACADAWLTLLFLGPSRSRARAWAAVALMVRAGRFTWRDPGGLLRLLLPHQRHLLFTGDLEQGRSLVAAHARRWRRIIARLR